MLNDTAIRQSMVRAASAPLGTFLQHGIIGAPRDLLAQATDEFVEKINAAVDLEMDGQRARKEAKRKARSGPAGGAEPAAEPELEPVPAAGEDGGPAVGSDDNIEDGA